MALNRWIDLKGHDRRRDFNTVGGQTINGNRRPAHVLANCWIHQILFGAFVVFLLTCSASAQDVSKRSLLIDTVLSCIYVLEYFQLLKLNDNLSQ